MPKWCFKFTKHYKISNMNQRNTNQHVMKPINKEMYTVEFAKITKIAEIFHHLHGKITK